jgi:hypothetical protein
VSNPEQPLTAGAFARRGLPHLGSEPKRITLPSGSCT